jgi:ADP-ribose pyrophosphatase YjhB (NUDIX family)
MTESAKWLNWSKRLQAIGQNGLTFASDPFDVERYEAVREIAAEMLAQGSGLSIDTVRGILTQEQGYATPKVDVRGVVFQEGKLLMVRERSDGKWTLPGGWADPCASPGENVAREIREESGYEARAERIVAVLDRSKHPHEPVFAFHLYKIFILCALVGGTETVSAETDGVGFFDEANLPELSITRVTRGQVLRMFEHYRNPELPPDFD